MYVPDQPLHVLFPNEHLRVDKMTLAENRVVQAFVRATETSRGDTRLPGYIRDVGGEQKDLVEHVMKKVVIDPKGHFVLTNDLPEELVDELSRAQVKEVIERAERKLLALKLSQLYKGKDVWYNNIERGIWEIKPSLMDMYRLNRSLRRLVQKTSATYRREELHGGRLRVVH